MAFLIKHSLLPSVVEVLWSGRAGAVRLRSLNNRVPFSVLGVHLAHGSELSDSLSSASQLLHNLTNNAPFIALGDYNVDILPSLHNDPYASHDRRMHKHKHRRDILFNWFKAHSANLSEPYFMNSLPFASCPYDYLVPITRLPEGDQPGLPSCLDYAATRGCKAEGCIEWELAIADHGVLFYTVEVQIAKRRRRMATTWSASDFGSFLEQAANVTLCKDTSYNDMVGIIRSLQEDHTLRKSRMQRRHDRMPFILRHALLRHRTALSWEDRRMWSKRVHLLRKKWLADMRDFRIAKGPSQGRKIAKTKKLYPVNALTLDGGVEIHDPDAIAEHIRKHFLLKWSTGREDNYCSLQQLAFSSEGISPLFRLEEVALAFASTRRKLRLDLDGVAPYALELLFKAQPDTFMEWFNTCCSSTEQFMQVSVEGMPAGKTSNKPHVEDVRLILPQSTFLTVVDVIIAERIHSFVSKALKIGPCDGFYVGARPRTQTLEIAHSMQLVLDKAGDLFGKGCIAQADIRAYYDNLPLIRLAQWLVSKGMDKQTVAVCVRHQALSSVFVRVQDAHKQPRIVRRGAGGLTGSRTAGALARICVEETFSNFASSWKALGFQRRIIAGSWVDNICVASDSPQKALQVLGDAEAHLNRVWSLSFKPSSKSIMFAQGCDQICETPGFSVVTRFKCLGHILTPTGSARECFEATMAAAWRNFWKNVAPLCRGKLPVQARISFLNRFVKPIITFRCPRWPFSKYRARLLDIIQRKMLRIVCGVQSKEDEPPDVFARRAARVISNVQLETGPWSHLWAKLVVSWGAHIARNTCKNSWCGLLLDVQSSSDLRQRRAEFSNRTATRASAGWMSRRWTDGVQLALEVLVSSNFNPSLRRILEDTVNAREQFRVSEDACNDSLIAAFLQYF